MRRFIYLFLLVASAAALVPGKVRANDYLELERNYQVYAKGHDCLHFKIPVWSYGRSYDYYACDKSYVSYKIDGTGTEYTILNYKSDSYSENSEDGSKGTAYINLKSGQGSVTITSMYSGVNYVVQNRDSWTDKQIVKQIDDDGQHRTILEFDWYPPESLDGKNFNVYIKWDIKRSYTAFGENEMSKTWTYTGFTGSQMVQTPQLYTPYIYQVGDDGPAGYGYAAVPYMLFQDPISYTTSLDNHSYNISDRAGVLYVMTTDTVQEQFRATFQLWRNQANNDKTTQKSTAVDIPPYHRIYNFSVTQEADATNTYTGNNVLSWEVKNPETKDLVDGDYFEIQRALEQDFSDAQTIDVVQMVRGATKGQYTYKDNSRDIWTGNADVVDEKTKKRLTAREPKYAVYDNENKPIAELDAELVADSTYLPGVPVYYRIRRASSSVWGWDTDFSKKATMVNRNFLAPLAQTQDAYTLDEDYQNNHKVNFRIKIENKETSTTINKDECSMSYSITRVNKEGNVNLTISYDQGFFAPDPSKETTFIVYDSEGKIIRGGRIPSGTYTFPINSVVEVKCNYGVEKKYNLISDAEIKCATSLLGKTKFKISCTTKDNEIRQSLQPYLSAIKDSLYKVMLKNAPTSYGRCMWDRTANLILTRTIEETGQTQEFIIPQDKIVRQDDGSWIATFSDVADQGCSHYKYSVRIDQSRSDLHVQDSALLAPVALKGSSLYFDEAATITLFEASQGDARTDMKNGVLLHWEASSSAVDAFVLQRVAKGSSNAPDTLYTGTDYDFFDFTAKPSQVYEYTITAHYSCNGRTTNNSASAEGWRTQYGEISGRVQFENGTGCYGTTVTLTTADGHIVDSMQTNAAGEYLFDSLEYNGNATYIVTPTSQYGDFRYNNTSSGSAIITMSADNAVASAINFGNAAAVRLTGRVLYKNSTIPVAGASFILNGQPMRRSNDVVRTGTDGNFELLLPKGQACKLQVVKEGHTFEGDGILRVTDGEETFALTKPLDGVRFYDMTKVRLVGRVAGGNDQRDLPEAFGLGTNNLGDNLQLVLQLEGDNTAHLVHDPNDLTRDTVTQTVQHVVYQSQPANSSRIVGQTQTVFEKKRIIIHPDPNTGEFEVDLFPVKYKVAQASANGYATLFAVGQGMETFDLTNAPLQEYSAVYDSSNVWVGQQPIAVPTAQRNQLRKGDSVWYNAVYDRIYHTPMQIGMKQMIYGLERKGLGEPTMMSSHIDPMQQDTVQLYTADEATGNVSYLLGYPVFVGGRKYQFVAEAYEDYYYNNDPQGGRLDRVKLRGGSVTIHNGLHSSTDDATYALDNNGRNSAIWLTVDNYDVNDIGENALRTVSAALEQEGNTVETTLFSGFITGTVVQEKDLRVTEAEIVLFDIIRDPGGGGSSAWVESGSTYNYSYKDSYDWETGVNLELKYGLNVSNDIGVVNAPQGVGSYIGSTYTTSKQLSLPIPITHSWSWGHQYDYSFTTTERISTSSSSSSTKSVGSKADVFFGTTISQVAGKAKTVSIIGDSLYNLCKPARDAGTMLVIAQGTSADGKPYYLVTGQKIVLGSTLENTFAYTQHYVLNTIIPELALERQNLLMAFGSEAEAKEAANALGQEVYWYHPEIAEISMTEALPESYYEMVTPDDDKVYNDRVAALNNMLTEWSTIIYTNEKEKAMAIGSTSMKVGTYSVSYGATVSHTENYSAAVNYNEMPQGRDLLLYETQKTGTEVGQSVAQNLAGNLKDFFESNSDGSYGTSAAEALKNYYSDAVDWASRETEDGFEDVTAERKQKSPQELGTVTNKSRFAMSFEPVLKFESDDRATDVKTIKKSAGFNIVADGDGDITVTVYRVPYDSWADTTELIRGNLDNLSEDKLYGSFVFITEAGATFCPHEGEERTKFYNKGTLIGNGTQWIVKPEMTADTYEIANVQPQNKATFRVQLMNNSQVDAGVANDGHSMTLFLNGESNPNGAVVTVDGMPLTQGTSFWVMPGKPVIKTIEVARGTVDDYENLQLMLYPSECIKTNVSMNLSVHFLPVSTDVEISMPRQNWIMNTISQRDSTGYYIPVEIDGFDINHKNFDHIEFQYKLSTESEEMWVNQCSFYASDSLYALATGNKAMISNGRIEPFRFYGERDPMEQRYDLRAVSFCRYGSGFVTKSSAVVSGTKDTRPPMVFGEPEPANSILGVGDNLKLRFNEPIEGNYLDADNNFQLMGVTNETGIASSVSLGFDGSAASFAATKVERNLSERSVSIDMMVKPASPNTAEVFFSHGEGTEQVSFGKTADNRLYISNKEGSIYSKPIEPMLAFTRIIATYDAETNKIRFYAGTKDVTDAAYANLPQDIASYYNAKAPLVFGQGFHGNMFEVRVWTKALTAAEISETHLKRLTGYELELAAYYRMDEGKGQTITDYANGATLYAEGTSWTLPNGISLKLDAATSLKLDGNLLARNSAQDETVMLWFKTASSNADLFKAGRESDSTGTLLAIESGNLVLHSGSRNWSIGKVNDNNWQHIIITVSRTYNTVSVFLNGALKQTFSASQFEAVSGAMYLGGNGFAGNIDDVVFFEQALPKSLVELYDNLKPYGDEMGLMGYLSFEEQQLNPNGILELVFSVNDQREFKTSDGTVVDKVVPLVVGTQPQMADISALADKKTYAPVRDYGKLTKLNFNWAFNNDELLINILNQDREVNKQSMFIIVRDVEDRNGNPMPSPVMWTAFVDHNSLKWDYRELAASRDYRSNSNDFFIDVSFSNHSGKRHQYTIESLPTWLTASSTYGSIDPTGYKTIRLTFANDLPVGEYSDLVYLTDENGLTEPLLVQYTISAQCPYYLDTRRYPLNMSVCGQILVNGSYDTDGNDRVIALYRNECVGMANIDFNAERNTSKVYLTVYGNEQMTDKPITFLLWQASTGKTFNLTTSLDNVPVTLNFGNGNIYGGGSTSPILFQTGGGEIQTITINPGWNWTSFNIDLQPDNNLINNVLITDEPVFDGDLIKNPFTRNFCVYDEASNGFVGSLNHFDYHWVHLVYSLNYNVMRVSGNALPADSMQITLKGNGAWNSFPCLLQKATSVAEALSAYYDYATPGDVIKSHDQFAVFSQDGRWEGNLTAVRPGEGYMLRRLGQGDVVVKFYGREQSTGTNGRRYSRVAAPSAKAVSSADDAPAFRNPKAATNMTMIAKVADMPSLNVESTINAYIGSELVGVATPQIIGSDTLFLLTIAADIDRSASGKLRFELDGAKLHPVVVSGDAKSQTFQLTDIYYSADAHFGSLEAPFWLTPAANCSDRPQKRIINGTLYIFNTDGKVYNAQGASVGNPLK